MVSAFILWGIPVNRGIAFIPPIGGLTPPIWYDLFDVFQKNYSLLGRIKTKFQRITFHQGQRIDYERAARYFSGPEDQNTDCYPTLIPNWDHSPRSGRSGHILINSTPKKFEEHAERTFRNVIHKPKEERIVFLKSWNEWAEGNYMEPDLKFGRGYLEALLKAINNVFELTES